MAKAVYIGVDNIARKVKKMYISVDGVACKIKKGYIGVNGVARLFYSGFPDEPTEYIQLGSINSSQTFVAPADGWYQIELFGRSGSGGASKAGSGTQDTQAASGGGGGGGAYCCSRVKLNEGDTITIAIGTTCTVTINSTTDETYSKMVCNTASDGGAAPNMITAGTGGAGGTASGGNHANLSGGKGGNGDTIQYVGSHDETSGTIYGGSGGSAAYTGGNSGGSGGRVSKSYYQAPIVYNPTSGLAGFAKIYGGNTN